MHNQDKQQLHDITDLLLVYEIFSLINCEVAHHVIARQQFLKKLCLLVLYSLDDKFIVAGYVEDGATCTRVGQLNQWLTAQ